MPKTAIDERAEGDLADERLKLQEVMKFLGAMASGMEDAVGETAKSITYIAGKELGKRLSIGARHTDDLREALDEVRELLRANRCMWLFEPFQRCSQAQMIEHSPDGDAIMLVFRDCMIRQSLFLFGHAQKGSLCNMMFGFFAGALESIMGRCSNLSIIHAGENACYKRLVIQGKV